MRNYLSKLATIVLLPLWGTVPGNAAATDHASPQTGLSACMTDPPLNARSLCFWGWLDNNISKEGITKDLEMMKSQGMGGAIAFVLAQGVPPGDVKFGTPEFYGMVDHTLHEAARLGLQLGFQNCSGWSSSGGPWVAPEDAMKRVIWTESHVAGGGKISAKLARPASGQPFYRDIAVLAVPESDAEADLVISLSPQLSSGGNPVKPVTLLDGNWLTPVSLKQGELLMEFAGPVEASALACALPQSGKPLSAEVEVSDDGKSFRKAGMLEIASESSLASFRSGAGNFPPAKGKFWKITFRSKEGTASDFSLGWLSLRGRPLVPDFDSRCWFSTKKADIPGVVSDPVASGGKYPALSQVVDLTGMMAPDGTVTWDAPPGSWTLLRMGFTNLAQENRPATKEGRGLEVDKFSKEAVKKFFAGYPARWAELAAKTPGLKPLVCFIDSYEAGSQNWGSDVPEAFQARHGYSIIPWLPVFTGRIVGSPLETDRFLWDLRFTFCRLFADSYYGEMRRLCHEHGMKLVVEPAGAPLSSSLENGCSVDEPCTEYWTTPGSDRSPTGSGAASIAHTSDQDGIVDAESFTSNPMDDAWQQHPRSLKRFADLALAGGINRMIYHASAHQAVQGAQITYGQWGINMNRSNTWFPLSRPFHDYIARCCALLQAGKSVSDILVLQEEAMPRPAYDFQAVGYKKDFCGPSQLMKDARVEDGRLVLASGTRYNLLVLSPACRAVRPELAEKIAGFAEAGLPIYGKPFTSSPSLAGQPEADSRVKVAAKRIWESGNKRIFSEGTVPEALAALGLSPEFQLVGEKPPKIFAIQRSSDKEAWYFLASAEDKPVHFTARFRYISPAVEIWNPVTGGHAAPLRKSVGGGTTEVEMELPVRGSAFVMFLQNPTKATGKEPAKDAAPVVLPGPWTVSFQPGCGAPGSSDFASLTDWSQNSDKGIRYFSGIATYSTEFGCPKEVAESGAVLDFDQVEVIGEVELNGKVLGGIWTPPYRIVCGKALKAGKNKLVVRVANNWVNRMIGDAGYPDDALYVKDSWSGLKDKSRGFLLKEWPEWLKKGEPRPTPRISLPTYRYWKADDPLLPSGLIGEVRLEKVQNASTADITASSKTTKENACTETTPPSLPTNK